jgi:DNA-binding CsgD family transcriptional regulator
VGDFDNALADLTTALIQAEAATQGERTAEWQALLDLGFLWASRDYGRTRDFYQRSQELARQAGHWPDLAHSLNRLGNWHLNVEQPLDALLCHQQALALFQALDDRHGLAETLDLLGMASYLSADLIGGTDYFRQAVALFRELDARQGLVSSLATLTMRAATFQTDTMVPAATLAEAAREGELALQIARDTGQRAGEAYALVFLAFCLAPAGEWGRALENAQRGLAIAQDIEHRQWQAAAHCALGATYHDILALPEARQHLEQALALARELGSQHWIHCATGYLAALHTAQNDLERAEAVLDSGLPPDSGWQTLGQRLAWRARAEHALARHDAALVIEIVDRLVASAPPAAQAGAIPRLSRLRAEALLQLGQAERACAELEAAHQAAEAQGARSLLWRIRAALGRAYRRHGKPAKARAAFTPRGGGLRRALAGLPPATRAPKTRAETPRQAARREGGGLTAREREVAALVAQGKSNREMAAHLVISERTVEHHLTNILSKLGLNSRAQVAVWAVEKGLAKPASNE